MIGNIIFFGLTGTLAGATWNIARKLSSKDEGGVFPVSLTWLPEALIASLVGLVSAQLADEFITTDIIHLFLWFGIAFGISYAGIQTGHHDALDMGLEKGREERDNTLTPIALRVAGKFGYERDSLQYDLIFWSIKGLVFTLPVGGLGVVFMPLGGYLASLTKPLQNYVSFYNWHFTREFLQIGLSAGVCVALIQGIF